MHELARSRIPMLLFTRATKVQKVNERDNVLQAIPSRRASLSREIRGY